jgi:hypothetical protein
MERTTAGAFEPRAFAAATYASKVFPLLGGLIALRKTASIHEIEKITIRKENLPNHPETTVARSLTVEPDGYHVKLLRHKGKEITRLLPTLLIVGDPDSELFPGLQTRIKTLSIAPIQIHTRIFEGTLRHRMRDCAPT